MVEKFFFRKFNKSCAFLVLLLFASSPLWAGHVSEKITLKVTNEKLVKVLEEIKRQSGYSFIYNEKYVKDLGGITVDVKEVSLDSVMKLVLKGTDLRYRIQDRIIMLEKVSSDDAVQKFKVIKGVVKDDRGEPLPGVTVLVKGTTIGVSTDANGNFALNMPEGYSILQFSFIGMETKDVKLVEDQTVVNVDMKMTVGELDEVIVSTGYTQTTQKRTTGSVAVVGREVFENRVPTSIDQLLQGQVAGVSIVAKSGRPGESAKIRIRGTNTLTGDAEPLWVVDGVPLQRNIPSIRGGQIKAGDFNDIFANGIAGINPNDIENVTILKDASAAAIYGSRAAGGVIVVTTKRGKAGKMSVNYSANFSVVMKPQRDGNLMNSKEKLAWEQELWDEFSVKGYNSPEEDKEWYPVIGIVGMLRANKLGKDGKVWTDEGFEPMNTAEQDAYIADLSKTTTNWFDELFRTAFSMNHYLSMSGGSDIATYYLSLGYSKDNGILKKTSYNRYNVSAKMNLKPHARVTVDFGVDFSQQKSDGSSLNVNPFQYAYFANPYEKPYNEDGSYRPDYTYFNLNQINGGREAILPPNGYNIMREIDETSSVAEDYSANLQLNLNYTISSKFRFSGLVSYSFINNKSDNINGIETYAAFVDKPSVLDGWNSRRTYGSITQASANNTNYSARGQLNYSDIFNSIHRLQILAGVEIRGSKAKSIQEKRYGYDPVTGNSSTPAPEKKGEQVDYTELVSMSTFIDGLSGQSIEETRFASFYASLDYSLYDKYIASLSFRTDGSNNFGSDEQFNPTWSLGLAWHVGDESFMDRLRPVLSRLKLSVAMGYTGNVNKSEKPELIMYYSTSYRKTETENLRIGNVRAAPNPHLRWEKTRDMKVALDFGLFDNRINGLVEAYYRLSKDLVTSVTVPYVTGFYNQGYNTSEMENKGIEATLQAVVVKYKDFKFNVSANIAWNGNKLKRYTSPISYVANNVVGYPQGAVFAGKSLGIDPQTGLYKYKLRSDADILKPSDLSDVNNYIFYKGTMTAPVTGGFNFNISYKTLTLSVGGVYSLNGKIVDEITSPVSYNTLSAGTSAGEKIPTSQNDLYVNHLNVRKDVTNRWTEERRTGVKYPRIIDYYKALTDHDGKPLNYSLIYPTSSTITRASMMESLSYLRVKNMSLSYALPQDVVKKMGVSSLSFSFILTNLFTITNYSGIDPETPGATYPLARSCSFGLSLGF